MHCLVIEKASANEIMGEINKNAGGGWECSIQVVVQGNRPSLYRGNDSGSPRPSSHRMKLPLQCFWSDTEQGRSLALSLRKAMLLRNGAARIPRGLRTSVITVGW
jgi:hypothetical protein